MTKDAPLDWQTLFDRIPVPVWIYEINSLRILAANQLAQERYGYSLDTLRSMTVLELRPETDRDRFLRTVKRFPHGLVYAGQWRHQKSDGSIIEVEITSHDITWEGRPARIVVAEDITARVDNEDRLRDRMQGLRRLLLDMPDGLVLVAEDGHVRLANPAAARLLGRSVRELESRALPELTGAAIGGTISLDGSDGVARHLVARVASSEFGNEPVLLYSLREANGHGAAPAEDPFLAMVAGGLDAADIGLMICEVRGSDLPLVHVNGAFERLTGYPASEALGRNPRFLQGNATRQAGLDRIRDAIRQGSRCEVSLRNERADGTTLWIELMLMPLRNAEGRITHWLGFQSDMSELRREEAELIFAARHDPITDLPWAGGQRDDLLALMAEARHSGAQVAVLHIDIDRFSTVNETMGHSVGDQALKLLAERIGAQLEGVGRVGRLGSDEFLAVVPFRTGELDPEELARQLRQRMESPMSVMPYSLNFTCSIGVACYPENADDADGLLHAAELALNRAKRAGRNQVRRFTRRDAERLQDRIEMAIRLRTGLEENQMRVYYQPQVNAQDGRLVGLEALLRWHTTDLGVLSSSRFISVAEELGLVVKLGRWIQEQVCQQLAEWLQAGHDDVFVALNVSIQQLLRPTYVLELQQTLRHHGVPARMIELELGETTLGEDAELVLETLRELREAGVRIVLDDFGSGSASLGHLKHLPADKLKIARELIADISTEGSDAAIARAIQAMGSQLKLKVLAQGVENAAQLGFLRRNHFDQFQGYLFGHAVDATEATRLLRQRYLLPEAFGAGAAAQHEQVLLLVDDEENVLRALIRLFRRDGYRILSTTRVEEAYELLAEHPVQVIVSDQRMPGTSGTEFLGRVKELYPDTIRMILSGYTDLATVTQSINRGAIYRFLTKPWNDEELREHIRGAFRTYAAQQRRLR